MSLTWPRTQHLTISRDIRLNVHKTQVSLLLCYVDHHDKAYDWAERRKLETHPKTGVAQLVEIRERVLQDQGVVLQTPSPFIQELLNTSLEA